MCLGIPMQVVACTDFMARCSGRHGEADIDLLLVGPQPVGTWLLTFLGAAREVIDAERAELVNAALDALDAVGQGMTSFESFFADLDREPQLPSFLRKETA